MYNNNNNNLYRWSINNLVIYYIKITYLHIYLYFMSVMLDLSELNKNFYIRS